MKSCHIVDLGLIGYAEAYALQKRIVAARKAGAIEDVLLLCEHPHVITLGRNGKRETSAGYPSTCCGRKAWSFTRRTAAETSRITGRGNSWAIRS